MKKITFTFLVLIINKLLLSAQTSFFTPTTYRGAFGTSDWTQGWANWTPQNTSYPATTTTISGDITSNATWTKNNVYLLSGFVYVKNNATLTIEAGTIIRGDKSTKGSLIITRGSKIIASGNSTEPIVFTSNESAGSRNYGDWGGLIILGKAKINPAGGTTAIEGGVDNANGDGQYGGTDDNDNSGKLEYVRIEFPGIAFQPNSEINGLTLGGVGSGTTIEHVQVSYSGDDSYEWFGGSVNARWLIAHRGWDDDFDTDFGYSGKVQFAVALRDSTVADQSGSNGFESDNDGIGSTNSPFTSALFSNVTIIGPMVNSSTTINSNFKRALHIRRNSRESVYNSIFCGYPVGFYLDGGNTLDNLNNNDLQFENNVFAQCTKTGDTVRTASKDPNFNIITWLGSKNNSILSTVGELNLTDPNNYDKPNFLPKKGSALLNGASFANPRLGGFTGIVLNTNSNIYVSVYPNPAQNTIMINSNSPNSKIEIVSSTGQLITSGIIINNIFDVSTIQNGIYIIKIYSEEKIGSALLSINR